MDKNCFNCAYCSEHYPSLVDVCDVDNHVVRKAEKEVCELFCKGEETYDSVS